MTTRTSTSTSRNSRAAEIVFFALLAAASAAAQNEPSFILFPESEQTFRQLTADPRHIHIGASYYRLDGHNEADAALGHSWGMAHWETGDGRWQWQTNIEAMAYSRFLIGGSVNQFETVDFLANLPLAVRHGGFSARAMMFHESSHLGDDFIRRTGSTGFRYSIDGTEVAFSYEPSFWSRIYCGMSYLLHTLPSPARKTAQWGVEFSSKDVAVSRIYPLRFYLAQDFQSHENVRYNVNSNTEAGVMIGFKDVKRFLRVYGNYFEGHTPYGQFFSKREHSLSLGVSFRI